MNMFVTHILNNLSNNVFNGQHMDTGDATAPIDKVPHSLYMSSDSYNLVSYCEPLQLWVRAGSSNLQTWCCLRIPWLCVQQYCILKSASDSHVYHSLCIYVCVQMNIHACPEGSYMPAMKESSMHVEQAQILDQKVRSPQLHATLPNFVQPFATFRDWAAILLGDIARLYQNHC